MIIYNFISIMASIVIGAMIIEAIENGNLRNVPIILIIIAINSILIVHVCVLSIYTSSELDKIGKNLSFPVHIKDHISGYVKIPVIDDVAGTYNRNIYIDKYRESCKLGGMYDEDAILYCHDGIKFVLPVESFEIKQMEK